jgi:hypothetical protein
VTLHPLNEPGEARTEKAGTVVVDDERNLEGVLRDPGLHDLDALAAFLDLEIRSSEIPDRRPVFVGDGDVDGAGCNGYPGRPALLRCDDSA